MGYRGKIVVECDDCGCYISENGNLYCEDCKGGGELVCGVESCDKFKQVAKDCRIGRSIIFTGKFDDEGRPIFVCESYLKLVKG